MSCRIIIWSEVTWADVTPSKDLDVLILDLQVWPDLLVMECSNSFSEGTHGESHMLSRVCVGLCRTPCCYFTTTFFYCYILTFLSTFSLLQALILLSTLLYSPAPVPPPLNHHHSHMHSSSTHAVWGLRLWVCASSGTEVWVPHLPPGSQGAGADLMWPPLL